MKNATANPTYLIVPPVVAAKPFRLTNRVFLRPKGWPTAFELLFRLMEFSGSLSGRSAVYPFAADSGWDSISEHDIKSRFFPGDDFSFPLGPIIDCIYLHLRFNSEDSRPRIHFPLDY